LVLVGREFRPLTIKIQRVALATEIRVRNKYLKKQKTNKINTDHTFIKATLKQTVKQQ
jgi:hypothetical protein